MKNYLDLKNEIKYEKLKEPAEIITNGGIVVFPTETVYGIGTNGLDKNAIEKLYKVKQRAKNKPISLLVSDINMINLVANITQLEYKLIEKFFPGPLTIILKNKRIVPDILTANTDTIGVRMPDNEVARKLIEYANVPIATPSANISEKPSGTNIQDIVKYFEDKVDYYIDEGESKIGVGSTVVKIVDGRPEILREGIITREEIYNCLNNIKERN